MYDINGLDCQSQCLLIFCSIYKCVSDEKQMLRLVGFYFVAYSATVFLLVEVPAPTHVPARDTLYPNNPSVHTQ